MLTTPEHSTENEKNPPGFWICLVALFLIVLVFYGKPVPFNNEFAYLLRLEPNFLPNDWSFSRPANEHWLFNLIFSSPAAFLSIEAVGWMGRILSWTLCLTAAIKLGRRWEIPYWAIGSAFVLWLGMGQSIANNEWIFGTFEAKTIAYSCLLFALLQFSRQKIVVPAILLGLSFSFHPAVGLWAIPSVGLAFLAMRIRIADLFKVIGLTFVFALPGIIPVLLDSGGVASPTSDDWKFVLTKLMPYHFDAFSFSRREMVLLGLMLVFNVVALWKSRRFDLRFLLIFQTATAGFFLLGVAFRWLELYPLMSYMPMRLFPVLTPLFFLFTAAFAIARSETKIRRVAVALVALLILSPFNPIAKGYDQIHETVIAWLATPDDLEKTLVWASQNTPADSVMVAPPRSRKLWYYSRRAQIVSYLYPRYDRLGEWRKRFGDVTGHAELSGLGDGIAEIDPAFERLSMEQILELKVKYGADYLVTRSDHPLPLLYGTPTYRVYQLK